MRWKMAALAALCTLCGVSQASAAGGFSGWGAVVVAGDNHAHDHSASEVFDNARRDIVADLLAVGFTRDNIEQFSVSPATHPGTQQTDAGDIVNGIYDIGARSSGCLVYITSHGSPDGVLINGNIWGPSNLAHAVDYACGGKPTVVVVSACYSGVFVPSLASSERLVVTAARPDRTSFGCGNTDRYTYFDQCFLQGLGTTGSFPDAAQAAKACVAAKEKQINAVPSEPQIALGNTAAAEIPRWR